MYPRLAIQWKRTELQGSPHQPDPHQAHTEPLHLAPLDVHPAYAGVQAQASALHVTAHACLQSIAPERCSKTTDLRARFVDRIASLCHISW